MTDEWYDDYEEIEYNEIIEENYPYPEIVQRWIKEGSNYSIENEFPITMLYFTALGNILKDFIRIPVRASRLDTRIHFLWLQTPRTGKTAAWKFLKKILGGTYNAINALNLNEEGNITDDLSSFDIFSVKQYSDAALVGTFVENDDFDKDNPEGPGNWRKTFVVGTLDGSGLAHWDEFESSGIFKTGHHKEEILQTFQTFMNDLDSESYQITKNLAGSANIGVCDCMRAFYGTTYVPGNLVEVILNSGVLQRTFMYVREVPDEIREKMQEMYIDGIGEEEVYDEPVSEFIMSLTKTYAFVKKKWEAVEKQPTKVITVPKEVKQVMQLFRRKLNNTVRTSRPEVKRVSESFVINLLQYQLVFATLIAVTERRTTLTVGDAHCAGRLMENAYRALVVWLEQALRVQRQSIVQKSGFSDFKQGYFDSTKDEEGWVNKKVFLQKTAEISKQSVQNLYLKYKNVKDNFEEKKIGRTAYIRIKEEEL
jgi:hypothetical protein